MVAQPDNDRRHILTVVLEDYCHVGPVSRVVPPDYWHRFESRVQRNVALTLDLLDEVEARATFFVLGWIADHHPEVVAQVAQRGHEIASKGYYHRSIAQMTPETFREDVRRSRDALQQATGQQVRGYRIPRGGLGKADLWALDILAEEGFSFDSSVRPLGLQFAREPHRRFIHRHGTTERGIWEVPLSTFRCGPLLVPISGGNYMRQLPAPFIRKAMAHWDAETRQPLVFYFHIWELDPLQPRISAVSWLDRIRQYRNLHAMAERIQDTLHRYRFGTIAEHLNLPTLSAAQTQITTAPIQVCPAPTVAPVSAVAPGISDAARLPVSVVVPCYNEEATLGYTSNTLQAFAKSVQDVFDVSYIFVDDGSGDQTWQRLQTLFGNRADCTLVRHLKNRGVAAATLTGIVNSPTEVVCAIDCDGTYDPKQLRDMVPMLTSGVDMVTASPYHPQGRVLNLSAWRLVLSKGLSILYRFFHRQRLYTYTSCFRVYRRSAIKDITLHDERFVGITELLSKLDLKGGTIVEYPAVMEIRLLGASKMKIVKTILGHLRLMARLINERVKTFGPASSGAQENYREPASRT